MRLARILMMGLCLAFQVRAELSPQRLAGAYNTFGFHLLREAIKKDPAANVFLSPPSAAIVLSMIDAGATDGTAEQILSALEVKDFPGDELNEANRALLHRLATLDPKIQLDIANALWISKKAEVEKQFVETNQAIFGASVANADFGDPGTVKSINQWVSERTRDKIFEMVQGPLDPDLMLIALNAVYFKGEWTFPFQRARTQDRPFHLANGTTITHPLMVGRERYDYLEAPEFQRVSLPYGDRTVSLKVFLPQNLDHFLAELNRTNWDRWVALQESQQGVVSLPRFKCEQTHDLKPVLQSLGIEKAFQPGGADFSGISQTPSWISWVIQKTFLNVDEEGTTAAAVTGIGMALTAMPRSAPFQMTVDRPFFIAIVERDTGLILFLGVIRDPR